MTGRCAPARAASRRTDRLGDLEAVELRHLDVQEQEVECGFSYQIQRLPAVGRPPSGMTPPPEQPFDVSRVELTVLDHR